METFVSMLRAGGHNQNYAKAGHRESKFGPLVYLEWLKLDTPARVVCVVH